jgi:hypothetical protein
MRLSHDGLYVSKKFIAGASRPPLPMFLLMAISPNRIVSSNVSKPLTREYESAEPSPEQTTNKHYTNVRLDVS